MRAPDEKELMVLLNLSDLRDRALNEEIVKKVDIILNNLLDTIIGTRED